MPPSPAEALRPIAHARLVPVRGSGLAWHLRTSMVIQASVLALLAGQLGRIPVLSTGTSEAPILLNDLCVFAMIAAGVMTGLSRRSFRIDLVGGIALLFAVVGAISAGLSMQRYGLSPMDLVVSLAYLARWLVYFGVYLVVINVIRVEEALGLWRTLELAILLFAAFGIVQAIFLPHFAQLVYPSSKVVTDWDEQGHRLVSTVLEPNIAGAMIMLVLLVELAQLAGGEPVALWKPILLFSALVAALSRSSLLGLMVGGAIILLVRGVSRRMLQAGAVLVMLLLASMSRILAFAASYNKLSIDASALTRLTQWLRALRVFSDHPIVGVGFNTYGFVAEHYGSQRLGASTFSVDGGLIFIAVMTGLLGLGLYVWMLATTVRHCRRVWTDATQPLEARSLATGIAAGTVAVCVQSLFVNSLLTPFVMEMLWVLWGLAFVIRPQRAAEPVRDSGLRIAMVQAA